jgi:pyridoxamine 5'-phosphate oxidase
MSTEELVPIGEAARRTGVATSTLRYYDERGLVRPARRSGGKRWYGTRELREIAFILMAQRLGIGLAKVGDVLNGSGVTWRAAIDGQIEALTDQIQQAELARTFLQHGRDCPHPRPWRDCPYMIETLDRWLVEGVQVAADKAEAELAELRASYQRGELLENEVDPDPIEQFRRWLHEALAADVPEPNAMVLATADADGTPSARTVLLKGLDAHGFVFFTNYESAKAADLAGNPKAELVFPWHAMERQVRVAGSVAKVTAEESEAYFTSRPRESRLGAWASRQSTVVDSRESLDRAYADVEVRWPDGTDIPLPDFWGGYRVAPAKIEFWQGRRGRLHDRLRYRREDDAWILERLAP